MFRNYLKISFRNLMKHKSFALINIFGLALGLTCCIIITKFVMSETGYDTYHKNGERLYRVSIESEMLKSGESWKGAMSPILWGPALVKEYPEIETASRMPGLSLRLRCCSDNSVGQRGYSYPQDYRCSTT